MLTALLLLPTLAALAAPISHDTFLGPEWSATGPGPHRVADTGWQVRAFDANDTQMAYRAGDAADGLQMSRGVPWGLPGAMLTYTGERATEAQTIQTVVEITGGPGGNDGRQTWLAGFSASPETQTRHLVLSFDTAGTNGSQNGQGGPGGWAGQTQTGGLKLYSAQGLLPAGFTLSKAPECFAADYALLSPEEPQLGHLYESILSYDCASGAVAVRVRDLADDVTVYEGRFTTKPCNVPLWPVVGGLNGLASWASDKGFALRVEGIDLDSSFRPLGRERRDPGTAPDDPLAHVADRPAAPCLRDFSGAVNPPGGALWTQLGVGWGRHDFSWAAIEPRQGEWHWADTDRMVLEAHKWGTEILPMLGYFVDWAVETGDDKVVRLRNPGDWEDFVEAVVARYSRPPFNLRYFQVWNEPMREAGFWQGESNDAFFTDIYLPAAKIIRRYGCQVVFGGWPCCGTVQQLAGYLEKHDAVRWTDILDIHYFELPQMVWLYDHFVAEGKCSGVWQTEVGWHPYPEYLPNLYCRTLYWGLKRGWRVPDQFKLFWYGFWGAGPDGIQCLTQPGAGGNEPSPTHGVRLATLNQVLGRGPLAVFEDYSCTPPLPFTVEEEQESSQGFRCGASTVIAFQISPETQAASPTLSLRLTLPAAPRQVTRWDSVGGKLSLAADYRDGVATVEVPLADMTAGIARNWGREVKYAVGYVVVE